MLDVGARHVVNPPQKKILDTIVQGNVKELTGMGVEVLVQPSSLRIFPDEAYAEAGATVTEDISQVQRRSPTACMHACRMFVSASVPVSVSVAVHVAVAVPVPVHVLLLAIMICIATHDPPNFWLRRR